MAISPSTTGLLEQSQVRHTLWRISNHLSLTGAGGNLASGRWHTAGHRIVYLAESPAGAMLEILVHRELDETELPAFYTLLKVVAPAQLAVELLDCSAVTEWEENFELTRGIGDEWLRSLRTPLARVPSAVMPDTWNYILNPVHEEARLREIAVTRQVRFDPRLLRKVNP
jgi:RES domain-containing protein